MRWLEYIVFLALVVGLARPVDLYLARVFERKPTFLDPALCPTESLLYRLLGSTETKRCPPEYMPNVFCSSAP